MASKAGSSGSVRWPELMAEPGARLHLYGKRETRPGRKMGHYTVLAGDAEAALHKAAALRTHLSPEFHLQPA